MVVAVGRRTVSTPRSLPPRSPSRMVRRSLVTSLRVGPRVWILCRLAPLPAELPPPLTPFTMGSPDPESARPVVARPCDGWPRPASNPRFCGVLCVIVLAAFLKAPKIQRTMSLLLSWVGVCLLRSCHCKHFCDSCVLNQMCFMQFTACGATRSLASLMEGNECSSRLITLNSHHILFIVSL